MGAVDILRAHLPVYLQDYFKKYNCGSEAKVTGHIEIKSDDLIPP